MPYFDYNATAPLLPAARQAWLNAAEQWPANPSSLHRPGHRANRALDQAREELAACLGCDPDLLTWTSGATESLNTVLHHTLKTIPPHQPVWISAVEHPAVRIAAQQLFGNRVRWVPVNHQGVLDWDRWLNSPPVQSEPAPGLIAVMAANNETGIIQPWETVRDWSAEQGIPYLCDAVQWLGRMPLKGLGSCSWVAGSAHKWGGPKGVGFLKSPPSTHVTPLLWGGSQEEGRRGGTENVAGAVAAVAALKECISWIQKGEIQTRQSWRHHFESALQQAIPEVQILGQGQNRLWNTVMAKLPGQCRARWLVKLDKQNCAVSTGSACASGKPEPSHVLLAMGCSPEETDHVVRLSSGWTTTEQDWNELLSCLKAVASELASEGVPLQPNTLSTQPS